MKSKSESIDGISKQYLTGDDIAKILGISRSKSFSIMKSGDLPTLRIGRNIRVKKEDFEKFVNENISTSITSSK